MKHRPRLNIDGSFELHSSRCLHDPSFVALALIVSEKMTKTQKLDKSLPQHRKSNTYVLLLLRRRDKNEGKQRCHSYMQHSALTCSIFLLSNIKIFLTVAESSSRNKLLTPTHLPANIHHFYNQSFPLEKLVNIHVPKYM